MVNKKVVNRIFNLLIFLFFATPFLYILFEQLKGNLQNSHLLERMQEDLTFNIAFITSFMMPFIGLYFIQIKKEIMEEQKIKNNLLKLVLFIISFLLLGNMTFGVGLAVLVILIASKNNIKIKDFKNHTMQFKNFIAPGLFILVAIFVRYLITFTI